MSQPILVQDVKPVVVQDFKPIAVKDNNDTDVPVIVKHQATNPIKSVHPQNDDLNDTQKDTNKLDIKQDLATNVATINPTQEFKDLINNESQASSDDQNDGQNTEPQVAQDKQDGKPTTIETNHESKPVLQENTDTSNEVKIDKPEDFEAIDNLPSDIAKLSTTVSDTSQQPKIYDTKEYHVPIAGVTHKHGGSLGTVIAGALSAVAVVVFIYFVAR